MDTSQLKHGITALIVIRNEESLIERCLSSLSNVVDEIILIHDGECEDNSLEIAKKYNCKITVAPFIGMPEFHMMNGVYQTTYEWILRIDADEYLSEELQNCIRELITSDTYSGYSVEWPIWDGEKYLTKNWPTKPILFRMRDMYFLEEPQSNFELKAGELKVLDDIRLEHRPQYNNYSWKTILTKQKRWAIIHADSTKRKFEEKRVYNFDYPNTFWYNVRNPRFFLRHTLRRVLPEILLLEGATFFVLPVLRGHIFKGKGYRYYYKVQIAYKVMLYLRMRKLI